MANQKEPTDKSKIGLAIVAAVFGLAGTIFGAYIQGCNNLQLEREKFKSDQKLERQKFETNLILKSIETGDTKRAAQNLDFLVKAGFISDPGGKIAALVKDPSTIPVLPVSALDVPGLGFRLPATTRQIREVVISDTQSRSVKEETAGLSAFKASYHYLIDAKGNISRLLEESMIAFHTAGHNESSIGVGLIHVSGEPYPQAQLDALTDLLADISRRNGLSPASIFTKSQVASGRKTDLEKTIDAVRRQVQARLAKPEGAPG